MSDLYVMGSGWMDMDQMGRVELSKTIASVRRHKMEMWSGCRVKQTWRGMANNLEANSIRFSDGLDVRCGEFQNISQISDLINLVDEFKYVK